MAKSKLSSRKAKAGKSKTKAGLEKLPLGKLKKKKLSSVKVYAYLGSPVSSY